MDDVAGIDCLDLSHTGGSAIFSLSQFTPQDGVREDTDAFWNIYPFERFSFDQFRGRSTNKSLGRGG
jgi:hypothetical protein